MNKHDRSLVADRAKMLDHCDGGGAAILAAAHADRDRRIHRKELAQIVIQLDAPIDKTGRGRGTAAKGREIHRDHGFDARLYGPF